MKLATKAAAVEALEPRQLLAGDGFSATIPFIASANQAAVAATPDNKILVAQTGYMQRFTADGQIDTTFGGGDAIVELNVPGMPTIVDMEVDSTGRIYIAGVTGTNRQFAVVRLNADGSADNSFGTNALALADFTPASKGSEVVQDLAVSPAGRVALVGEDGRGSGVLAVFNSSGRLDNTFDGDGKLVWGLRTDTSGEINEITYITAVMYEAAAVDFAPDGRIIVGGTSDISHIAPPGLIIDSAGDRRWQLRSHSATGHQIWSKSDRVSENSAVRVADLDVLADGSILVAGGSIDTDVRKIAPDGSIDPDALGLTADFLNGRAVDIAACPDGSFYLLTQADGSSVGGEIIQAYLLYRFSPQGQLDPDFDGRSLGTTRSGAPADLTVLGSDAITAIAARTGVGNLPTILELRRHDADSVGSQIFIDKKGTLKILGTESDDELHVHGRNDGRTVVTVNGLFKSFNSGDIKRIHIYGFNGNDKIDVGSRVGGVYIEGNDGDDDVIGGYANDTILGGSGNDTLSGNVGDDLIFGNSGRDKLWGADGNDTLYGQGGIDSLNGDAGDDFLSGGLDTRDNLFGGSGADADVDAHDRDNRLDVELSVINFANA